MHDVLSAMPSQLACLVAVRAGWISRMIRSLGGNGG